MRDHDKKWIQYGVLALALVCIGAGILRGEQNEVFQKAINICLQCIGIG